MPGEAHRRLPRLWMRLWYHDGCEAGGWDVPDGFETSVLACLWRCGRLDGCGLYERGGVGCFGAAYWRFGYGFRRRRRLAFRALRIPRRSSEVYGVREL